MAFTAADVMTTAADALNDRAAVRWTAPDLRDYLNAGLREIATIKPNARSETRILTLVEGVQQTLPADVTTASSFAHNVGPAPGNAIGAAIGELNGRALMDRSLPGWSSPSVLPYSVNASNVIYDIANPREFLVVPGNTGAGRIAAVVGIMPTFVPVPGSNSGIIASYTTTVDLPDEYRNALVDFVLYRAFSRDAGLPNAQGRAAGHLQAFSMGVTGKFQAETGIATPSTSGTSKTV